MTDELIQMPKELTAENGAKYLFMGEFNEVIRSDCPVCLGNHGDTDEDCYLCLGCGRLTQTVTISWTTIKEIYAKAVEHFHPAPSEATPTLGETP